MSTVVTASPELKTPLASRPAVSGPEALGILLAACAVLCLLLYGILAALREILGQTTCVSFLLLLTAAVLWLIARNSKLSYHRKARWVAAVAIGTVLIGIGPLNTSRATPLSLSAGADNAQALAFPSALKDSDPLDFMKANPALTTTRPRQVTVSPAKAAAQLSGYIEALKNNVTGNWNLSEVATSTPAGATVYIQFGVRRRGNHAVPTLETPSGSSSLDASCLHAVNRTPVTGHFPASYTGDTLTVLYHCTYPGSSTTRNSTRFPVQELEAPTNNAAVVK